MAIVITNGKFYVKRKETGAIRKTTEIDKATIYNNVDEAVEEMKKAPARTKGFYVYDTVTMHICWRWFSNKKKKRRNFSKEVRQMVYNKAEGRCQLCGKKITLDEMTLDHIVPLGMGGRDEEDNLQCSCRSCNEFKSNILPEEFENKINTIFFYQSNKKYKGSLRWKIAQKLLNGILEGNL